MTQVSANCDDGDEGVNTEQMLEGAIIRLPPMMLNADVSGPETRRNFQVQ